MIMESDIRAKLIALSQGQISLADLEEWLGDASWNMHRDSQPEAVRLASEMFLAFSAYDAGYSDEARLRSQLILLISDPVIIISVPFEYGVDVASPDVWSSANTSVMIDTGNLLLNTSSLSMNVVSTSAVPKQQTRIRFLTQAVQAVDLQLAVAA